MIAALSLLILIAGIAYFFYKLKENGIKPSHFFIRINDEFKTSIQLDDTDKKSTLSLLKLRSILIYISLLIFIIMLFSGFVPTAFTGESLSGLFLIIHVTFAPLFSVFLAMLLLFYANRLKMLKTDFRNLENFKNKDFGINSSIIKLVFWSMSILSIPLLFSIILILYPIFGTEVQEINVFIHRLSAIIFSLLTFVLIYFVLISEKKS